MIQTDRRRPPRAAPDRSPRHSAPPALESGDSLSRDEFERRYGLRPDLKKAELVEGVVYVASPVRNLHGYGTSCLHQWLGAYARGQSGVHVRDNVTVRLDRRTEVQPDLLLRRDEAAGGRSRIDDDDYIAGAPELVAEVALSSAAVDLGAKRDAYARAGLLDYIVWDLEGWAITWFALVDGAYVPREPDAHGIVESDVFAGLRLDVGAMLGGDLARVLDGLADHAGGPGDGAPPA